MPKSQPASANNGRGTPPRRNQVRIIAGAYRRRLLSFPDLPGLRPTPDRVRETLFNWLGQELHGQCCLDLFAGSGALGFEAASRGARKVVMVEQARPALVALQENRQMLAANAIEIVPADALAWLKRCRERFDLVFLDPPFASDLLPRALALLPALLEDDAHVYVESASRDLPAGWEVLRSDRAGQAHYSLLRRV